MFELLLEVCCTPSKAAALWQRHCGLCRSPHWPQGAQAIGSRDSRHEGPVRRSASCRTASRGRQLARSPRSTKRVLCGRRMVRWPRKAFALADRRQSRFRRLSGALRWSCSRAALEEHAHAKTSADFFSAGSATSAPFAVEASAVRIGEVRRVARCRRRKTGPRRVVSPWAFFVCGHGRRRLGRGKNFAEIFSPAITCTLWDWRRRRHLADKSQRQCIRPMHAT